MSDAQDIITTLIRESGMTKAEIASKLGVAPATINKRLSSENMGAGNWLGLLTACGYSLEIKNVSGEAVWFYPGTEEQQADQALRGLTL